MKSLYDLSTEMSALMDQIDETGLTPEMESGILGQLTQTQAELESKADAYGCLIASLSARADARKAEADRMAALARTDVNTVSRLKERKNTPFAVVQYSQSSSKEAMSLV
jgi:multidrug resistance efflux pump